jgi:enoyl-CoA hydratase/carnithine racemase
MTTETAVAELVHHERDGVIATITLDSPHNRNALSTRLVDQLGAHLDTAMADPDIRAVLLTHTGTVFCSGADLKEQTTAGGPRGAAPLAGILTRLLDGPKPVLVRVDGHVRAGGLGIVAACDIAIASTTATFAVSEVRLGLIPAVIATVLTRRMTPRAISRYLLTGDTLDPRTAVGAGLISQATDAVDETVEGVLAAWRRAAPHALARTKRLLGELPGDDLAADLERTAALSADVFASPEGQEGMAAFLQRRDPTWTASS